MGALRDSAFSFGRVHPLHILRALTFWRVHGAVDRQDVLVNQFDGARPVGDLVVEVVGQPRSLQLQLLGLQGRLCRRLCAGHSGTTWKQIYSSRKTGACYANRLSKL